MLATTSSRGHVPATDDCGNATSATQTITIIDTTAPGTIHPDYGRCSDDHPMDDATATDGCEVVITVDEVTTAALVLATT